jgi:hypothetical protein
VRRNGLAARCARQFFHQLRHFFHTAQSQLAPPCAPNNQRSRFIAHKWCKVVKTIEEGQVSSGGTGDFHKLINTVVEILQK